MVFKKQEKSCKFWQMAVVITDFVTTKAKKAFKIKGKSAILNVACRVITFTRSRHISGRTRNRKSLITEDHVQAR